MEPRERPLLFGEDRLLGVLSEPPDPGDRPGVIILNAGLIYRVGPGRLSVDIARSIARMGFVTFRFDLSGIGDSEPRAQPLSSVESAIADARQAMDALVEESGIRQFVLCGLCSGAVHAHHIAVADPRVVGAAMLDTYVFPTLRSGASMAMERLRPMRRLPGRTLSWAKRRLSASRPTAIAVDDDAFIPPWPTKSRAEADLTLLRNRGVALLFVFSGEWTGYRNEGQMSAAMRSVEYGSLLAEVRIPRAEHLYFTRPERDMLLRTLQRWLCDRWERRHE